jgi:hypothetical protein
VTVGDDLYQPTYLSEHFEFQIPVLRSQLFPYGSGTKDQSVLRVIGPAYLHFGRAKKGKEERFEIRRKSETSGTVSRADF